MSDLSTITPLVRREQFLQDIADGKQTMEPITREEEFLRRISANGGGGVVLDLSFLDEFVESELTKAVTAAVAAGDYQTHLYETAMGDEFYFDTIGTADKQEAAWLSIQNAADAFRENGTPVVLKTIGQYTLALAVYTNEKDEEGFSDFMFATSYVPWYRIPEIGNFAISMYAEFAVGEAVTCVMKTGVTQLS